MTVTEAAVSFSHVHLYVDHLEDLADYKALETKLNQFCWTKHNANATALARRWHDEHGIHLPYQPQKRDIVKQWIAGLGFRITGARYPSDDVQSNTRSVLVTSKDFNGIQFVVTAVADTESTTCEDDYRHFDAGNVSRFYKSHANRQGVGVLAFEVDSVASIESKYRMLHPKLIFGRHDYENAKILEVFAYYDESSTQADEGTVLRFVEKIPGKTLFVLPGFTSIPADFDQRSQPAYCDHWVSNVQSRTGFLQTLEDTLGFTPKVDFNAGVVAAGEAQIESTVTGNESHQESSSPKLALQNQSQVYLPINNALSEVGHVHGFLKEIGQGIQHVASRVEDLVVFVQQANDWRDITGEGFTFLRIPRSYYGILTVPQLIDGGKVSAGTAEQILEACQRADVVTMDGAVDLELTGDDISDRLLSAFQDVEREELLQNEEAIVATILKSRYVNLQSLLRDHVSESSYLGIVRNQILVDVQGEDLLYQIFTSNILQRKAGDEAPFLEFIQRVCSECKDAEGCPVKMKPGCGGFGIRNFLTLFLSIEVSKAMLDLAEAKVRGDEGRRAMSQAMVDCFTDQLNESNPILTEISDAMTREGYCRDMLTRETDETNHWSEQLEVASQAKLNGNQRLMECSTKYKERMTAIRTRKSEL